MESMDGQIHFGENDNFRGLLVEGIIPPVNIPEKIFSKD